MKRRMIGAAIALATGASLALAGVANAQPYPQKPVRIIVPFTAGGASDILARMLASALRDPWGQPITVENRTGGNGVIGLEVTAKAPADGYTLVVSDLGSFTILPTLAKNLPIDVARDLAPVTVLTFSPYFIVTTPSLPPKSLQELVDYAKANRGKLNYATPGLGSNVHLAGLQFARSLGIDWVYIPSKGGAQAMQDVAGGHADLMLNSMLATAPQVKSGNLRLLGITSPKRLPGYPDVPAANELVPGFTAGSWQGLLTTAGTPREVIAKVQSDVAKLLATPAMKERVLGLGAEPIANTPEEMSRFLVEERARWAKVIQDNDVKLEQ